MVPENATLRRSPTVRVDGDGVRCLLRQHRLAGQRGLVHVKVLHVGEPKIGRHLVARFEQYYVPGYQLVPAITRVAPPRTVRASAESMLWIESRAFSALPS